MLVTVEPKWVISWETHRSCLLMDKHLLQMIMNSPTICVTVVAWFREIVSSNNIRFFHYWSERYQNAHWKTHKKICQAIQELSKLNKQTDISHGDGEDPNVFISHINPKQHTQVSQLVGKRCTAVGELNNKQLEMLWTLVPR